jgi:putative flippase GtrA
MIPIFISQFIQNNTIKQIAKFICIGTLAAIVNFIVDIFLVEVINISPLLANIFGFAIAFQVSFLGHRFWTFYEKGIKDTHIVWIKFLTVALFSLGLNQLLYSIYLIFIDNYIIALFFALITVPPITFIISKLWAFK